MIIQGLQKLSLLDYPEHVACTVFLSGCNFRCPFCHNASLVTHNASDEEITVSEFMSFLLKRKGILDGVCITGGEPLLNAEILDLIKSIRDMGYSIKLDTNGSRPEFLAQLIDEKMIDYVAMDIKNAPYKYPVTTGVENIDVALIYQSVEILKSSKINYEFRTTLVREFHDIQDMENIGQWLKGNSKYYLQGFVDSGDLICTSLHPLNTEKMKKMLMTVKPYLPRAKLRGIS